MLLNRNQAVYSFLLPNINGAKLNVWFCLVSASGGCMGRKLLALFFVASISTSVAAENGDTDKPIKFGLTAVVVQENLRFLDDWEQYLSTKLGRQVEFVRRHSYQEIIDMLDLGSLDFAWICGFPYIQKRDPEYLGLLSTPVYKGEPLYQSLIIVNKDSPYHSIDDLKGKVFAFSDPNSNSGFLYPQTLLIKKGVRMDNFFRQTFFTYNHAETVEAVAAQLADGGAVDSYIWEYMELFKPDIVNKTRVIQRSPRFGFPPLVYRLDVDKKIVELMQRTLMGMNHNIEGRTFLAGLKLDAFSNFSPSLFDSIREMADFVRREQSKPHSTAATAEAVH